MCALHTVARCALQPASACKRANPGHRTSTIACEHIRRAPHHSISNGLDLATAHANAGMIWQAASVQQLPWRAKNFYSYINVAITLQGLVSRVSIRLSARSLLTRDRQVRRTHSPEAYQKLVLQVLRRQIGTSKVELLSSLTDQGRECSLEFVRNRRQQERLLEEREEKLCSLLGVLQSGAGEKIDPLATHDTTDAERSGYSLDLKDSLRMAVCAFRAYGKPAELLSPSDRNINLAKYPLHVYVQGALRPHADALSAYLRQQKARAHVDVASSSGPPPHASPLHRLNEAFDLLGDNFASARCVAVISATSRVFTLQVLMWLQVVPGTPNKVLRATVFLLACCYGVSACYKFYLCRVSS